MCRYYPAMTETTRRFKDYTFRISSDLWKTIDELKGDISSSEFIRAAIDHRVMNPLSSRLPTIRAHVMLTEEQSEYLEHVHGAFGTKSRALEALINGYINR